MQRLNLFKVANDRLENSVKQQKIMTRTYLILLTGRITFIAHVFIIAPTVKISLFTEKSQLSFSLLIVHLSRYMR